MFTVYHLPNPDLTTDYLVRRDREIKGERDRISLVTSLLDSRFLSLRLERDDK